MSNESQQIVLNRPIRRIVWSLISHMRLFLKVDIHPIITNSFMSIHYFFQNGKPRKYKLYIIIITSVFTSCKKNEISRSLYEIFRSFLKSCDHFSKVMDKSIIYNVVGINNFENSQISDNDLRLVNDCELDLIEANDCQIGVNIPLNYIYENVFPNLSVLPSDVSAKIRNALITSLSALLCSEHCLDYDPEIMAVTATRIAFGDNTIPEQIMKWVRKIINESGDKTMDDAKKLFKEQINEITNQ